MNTAGKARLGWARHGWAWRGRCGMTDLRNSLTEIYSRRGELTPQIVVDEAREETHELHHRFEWDDEIAGEAYRRVQAAELIRSVKITYRTSPNAEPKRLRAFQSLDPIPDRTGYAPTEEVVGDEFSKKLVLREIEREIGDLKRKYGHIEEFASIVNAALEAS